jgi:hypothetical protein
MTGTWLNPTMTSNSLPYGVASASSELGSPYEAWNSFDHDVSIYGWTVASGTTGWLQYKFQSGVGVDAKAIINEYKVTGSSASFATRSPKTWTLKASNTGAFSGEEVTLDTRADENTWGVYETRTYTFANSTGYYFYRWVITANNGGVLLQTAELQLWGAWDSGGNNESGISMGSANMMAIGM